MVRGRMQNGALGIIVYDPAACGSGPMPQGRGPRSENRAGRVFRHNRRRTALSKACLLSETLSDGKFIASALSMAGRPLGTLVLCLPLRIGDVRCGFVSTHKAQMARSANVSLLSESSRRKQVPFWYNKSSVHFRAEFSPIAETILVCTGFPAHAESVRPSLPMDKALPQA